MTPSALSRSRSRSPGSRTSVSPISPAHVMHVQQCMFKPGFHSAYSSLTCTCASAVVPGLFQLFAAGGIDLIVFKLFAAETLELCIICRSVYKQTKRYRAVLHFASTRVQLYGKN